MNAIQTLLTEHLDIWTAADTEKKSGRGRASGNATRVYGIRKLRELILELAVRGKLVPQDANDEPASVLLKRIQAEKAKLIADGKIKSPRNPHLSKGGSEAKGISEDEKPFALPQGWAYSRLGDAVEIIRGITFPGSEKTRVPEKGRVACLRTTNVQDQIEWDDLLYIREEFVSREDQILMPRDIVMSMANSRELVGKVALVGTKINQKTSFGGFLGVLRPFLIEPRFVMALLRTPGTREALIDSASQTTNIANISLAKLRPLFFAIPPLAEQHRIVAKVDELMALCDQLETRHNNTAEAHEKMVGHLLGTLTQSQNAADFSANWQRIAVHFDTLFTTEASIDALKQTLLHLAYSGRLSGADMSSWDEVTLSEITDAVVDIDHKMPKAVAEGVIFLSAKDLKDDDTLDFSQPKYISREDFKHLSRRIVPRRGDIIYSRIGARLGKARLVTVDTEFLVSYSCCVIRPNEQLVSKEFLVKFLDSRLALDQAHLGKQSIGVPDLGLGVIKGFKIPLPTLVEQSCIVAKVDELMTLCDQLKSRITDARRLQQKLADVMVKQAVA